MRPLAPLFPCMLLALCGCGSEFTAGDAGTGGGSGGSGGGAVSPVGCADGEREGYADLDTEPNIAACAGGFDVPGLTSAPSKSPKCGRETGDDHATNKKGGGCSAADLCAAGWHVCESAADVGASAAGGACLPVAGAELWATRQAQDLNGTCQPNSHNNLVGCGPGDVLILDSILDSPGCAPLNTALRWTHCALLSSWFCGVTTDANAEADVVVKSDEKQGGVLCCRD